MKEVTLNSYSAFTIPFAGVHEKTGLIVRSDGYVLSPAGHWLSGNSDSNPGRRLPYKRVTIYKDGSHTRYMVHRLVAETFLCSVSGKETVDHKDRDSLNNDVFNLRFADRKEQALNRKTTLFKQTEEERKARQKAYKDAHRLEIRRKSNEYYAANRERILTRMRNFRRKKKLASMTPIVGTPEQETYDTHNDKKE